MRAGRHLGATLAALCLLAAAPPGAAAQAADSTVCVSFRTRTTSTGKIATTSVAKVPCGGAAGRVDTVTVVRVDTLRPTPAPVPLDPRGYNCWLARDAANPTCIPDAQAPLSSNTLVLRRYGQTFGFTQWMWHGVIYPTDPSLPTTGTVRVDTVTLRRVDTVTVARVDTVRLPGRVDTVRVPAPPVSNRAPELPRGMAAMDSMLKMARAIDTMDTSSWPHIRQDSTGKWVCYLNCNALAASRVLELNGPPPKGTPKKKAAPPKKATPPVRKEPVG